MTIQFGKYRGLEIRVVPLEYLYWLKESNQKIVDACTEEIERRERIESADLSTAAQMILAGYRHLMKTAHPDTGGDPAKAAAVLDDLKYTREYLEDILKAARAESAAPPPPAAEPPKKKAAQQTYWCKECQAYHQRA